VSIKYKAEQEYLVMLAQGTSFWASGKGISGSISEFEWQDVTLVSSGYTNWAEGHPRNNPLDNVLIVRSDGKWLAVPGSQLNNVMCELEIGVSER